MLYQIRQTQCIKGDLSTLWQFISHPKNLAVITPPSMKFSVHMENQLNNHIYPGQFIEYSVSPFLGIKLYWLTEITHVKDQNYFVDEQRIGPYRVWHHQHILKEVEGGVEMSDLVHYQLPLGILGRLAHALFVRKKLEKIFEFRRKKMEALFGHI